MRVNLKRLLTAALLAATAAGAAGCASAPPETTLAGDYLSGRFAAGSNAIDAAARAYGEAHEEAPQQLELMRDAFFFRLAAGDVDAAADYARKILASGGADDDGLARLTLAAEALKAGDQKAARADLVGEMDAPFLKSIAWLTNVWIERDLAGPAAALEKIDNPGSDIFSGFNPLHKALLAEEAGRMEEARKNYQAAAFGVGGPVARSAFGGFLERSGDLKAARDYYTLLASDPGPARRLAENALKRLDAGKPASAFKPVAVDEGAALVFYSFAAAFTETTAGQRARAANAGFSLGAPQFNTPLVLAQIALYLDPHLDEARRLVGGIFNLYGEYDAAEAVLAKIPPSSNHYEQARIEIAAGLAGRGDADRATRVLKNAIRTDPEGDELKLTLANLYASEEHYEDAVNAVNGVIEALPEDPHEDAWRYFVARGGSLIELGRWEEAEADLERAVELAPDEPTALNYLGYSWAERGVHLDKAFALIEKAAAALPHSGAIVDSLGWAHYQLGDYGEAVTHLEKAASLEPSDPTITDHLGDVYWRLGRKIEARYQWRRALELDPSDTLASALREKLESGLPANPPARNGA